MRLQYIHMARCLLILPLLLLAKGASAEVTLTARNSAADGLPTVVVDDSTVGVGKPFSLAFSIEPSTPIAVGQISVDAIMPAHLHGLNYEPTVVSTSNGAYQAENFLFHMPGHWLVTFQIKSGDQTLNYNWDLDVR